MTLRLNPHMQLFMITHRNMWLLTGFKAKLLLFSTDAFRSLYVLESSVIEFIHQRIWWPGAFKNQRFQFLFVCMFGVENWNSKEPWESTWQKKMIFNKILCQSSKFGSCSQQPSSKSRFLVLLPRRTCWRVSTADPTVFPETLVKWRLQLRLVLPQRKQNTGGSKLWLNRSEVK